MFGKFPRLETVEDSDKEHRLRLGIQSLMGEKNASIAYTFFRNGRFSLEKIFSDRILDFSIPSYALKDALDKLKSLEYGEGVFPSVVHVYEKLIHPSTLELVR